MDPATVKKFLDKKNRIAIVGASANPEKWGYKVYRQLKAAGFTCYPVNPGSDEIDGDRCFPDLKSLPGKKPDVVVTIVPPRVTERVVERCRDLGIEKVWMQPGSESETCINFCKDNDIEAVHDLCFVVDGLGGGGGEGT